LLPPALPTWLSHNHPPPSIWLPRGRAKGTHSGLAGYRRGWRLAFDRTAFTCSAAAASRNMACIVGIVRWRGCYISRACGRGLLKDIDTFECLGMPHGSEGLSKNGPVHASARYPQLLANFRGSHSGLPSSRTWSALARAEGFLPLYFPSALALAMPSRCRSRVIQFGSGSITFCRAWKKNQPVERLLCQLTNWPIARVRAFGFRLGRMLRNLPQQVMMFLKGQAGSSSAMMVITPLPSSVACAGQGLAQPGAP
jgi:hypothetical protein